MPELSGLHISADKRHVPAASRVAAVLRSLVWIAPFLLVGILFWGKFGEKTEVAEAPRTESRTTESVPAKAQSPAPTVKTAALLSEVLNATGYVVAQRSAAVASKATGRLAELRVVEGDEVEAGAVLAVLEHADLVATVHEGEARLAALRAQTAVAQTELEDASRNFKRMTSMSKGNLVSQSELDAATFRFRKTEAQLLGAQANVAVAEAALERARIDLQYTYIVAPFAGTVLTKDADIGEIVAPFGSSTSARAAVVTMADMTSLEIEADVSESNITRVTIGQPCTITLDARPEKRYRGKVSKIVPTVDRSKATVLVKIKFLDSIDDVLPEMSAKIAFDVSNKPVVKG